MLGSWWSGRFRRCGEGRLTRQSRKFFNTGDTEEHRVERRPFSCPVILSGVAVREANGNVVEGPLAGWNYPCRLREFSPRAGSSGGNSLRSSCRCGRAWGPSTARLLRIREAVAPLRMTGRGVNQQNPRGMGPWNPTSRKKRETWGTPFSWSGTGEAGHPPMSTLESRITPMKVGRAARDGSRSPLPHLWRSQRP
jgi:hypothetical protein